MLGIVAQEEGEKQGKERRERNKDKETAVVRDKKQAI
jgi:hypothetical protein